ncbi:TRAP transporter substrate-binding protein [Bacillaceae bacterium]
MKKGMKSIFLLVFSALFLLSACGGKSAAPAGNSHGQGNSSASGQSYTFKLTHVTQPTHVWHKTAEKFNEELQKRSNGRMKVDIFPASQLGTEKDMMQQLESGTIDFGFMTNGYMSTRSESLNGWFMPFLFENLEQASKARETEAAKQMLKELEKQGLIGMDFIFAGNRHVLMKSGSVSKPEDLKGKKVRIIGSPAIQEFWTALGAGPTPMPLPEVYTALQTGVIDGIDIDLDALVTQKYYEIAKDLTLTNHMTFPSVIVMSKASYDKLSPEDQKIVTEAMKAAVDWGIQEAIKREKTNLEEVKAKGVNVVELTDKSGFNAVKEQIYKQYSEKNPIIKAFIEENKH